MALIGIGLGVLVWLGLRVGLARATGRDLAILLGAATATPFVLYPLIVVGTPIGIYAGYLVPTAVALIVGLAIARGHPDRTLGADQCRHYGRFGRAGRLPRRSLHDLARTLADRP